MGGIMVMSYLSFEMAKILGIVIPPFLYHTNICIIVWDSIFSFIMHRLVARLPIHSF